MFIMVNDEVSVEDLVMGIIVASGNDASETAAEGIAELRKKCLLK